MKKTKLGHKKVRLHNLKKKKLEKIGEEVQQVWLRKQQKNF